MPKLPGKCIFCGNGRMSKEHLWPEWFGASLSKKLPVYYNIKTRADYQASLEVLKQRTVETRPGDPTTKKVRRVCKSCNSGWMSRLQQRAKPVLTLLMDGQDCTVPPEAQRLIASWITMTTMCADADDKPSAAVSSLERLWMMEQERVPFNWRICIGRFAGDVWVNRLRHHGMSTERSRELRRLGVLPLVLDGDATHDTQVTTLTAGHLLIQAFSSAVPIDDFDAERYAARLHLRFICPTSGRPIRWGEMTVLDDWDAEAIADALRYGIPA
jgi:hypothetical protein